MPPKGLVMQGLKEGTNFAALAADLNVAQATAKVYRNDCFAAGTELDHETIATFLDGTKDYFSIINVKLYPVKMGNHALFKITLEKSLHIRSKKIIIIIIISYKSAFFDGCEIIMLCVLACLIHNLEM